MMTKRVAAVRGLAALAIVAAPASAGAADDVAARFGMREAVEHISLSPDGTKVAIVEPAGPRGSRLVIGNMVTGTKSGGILSATGEPDKLHWCGWSTNERLVCGISTTAENGVIIGFSRLLAVNADGSGMKIISAKARGDALGLAQAGGSVVDWLPEVNDGTVLMMSDFVAEASTGTIVSRQQSGAAVEAVNTVSLKRRLVEQPNGSANEYISDGHGTIRIMGLQPRLKSGDVGGRIVYQYRRKDGRQWEPLSEVDFATGSGFEPYAVDRDLNVAYGFKKKDGRQALYRVALDGSRREELVLERPDVDVDMLIQFGRQRRVVGASYATDQRFAEFFEPELQRLRVSLGKALPNQPIVTFVDASADESKLLLFAGSDTDPGRYYLYDQKTRKLAEVAVLRPQLATAKLAAVKPVTFRAADGVTVPGYLTLPPGSDGKGLPAIVMPHGGPAARDEWGFDWLAQFFASKGYAVLQPNYRGSSGYGDEWFQRNGWQSWHIAVGDIAAGGRWLVESGIADADKLSIVGWSYGGYAALQSGVTDPGLFRSIVAIAPVTDLDVLREESRRFSNYTIMDRYIGRGPHVAAGSPARHAAKITAPVLLYHGREDANVGVGESRLMKERLLRAGKSVTLVEFEGLDHQLDDSVVRSTMLDGIAAFLAAKN